MKLRLLGREVEGNDGWRLDRFPFWAEVHRMTKSEADHHVGMGSGGYAGHLFVYGGHVAAASRRDSPQVAADFLSATAARLMRELGQYLDEVRSDNGK